MSEALTSREHDDMRDLLLAGTQRIRPARSQRARISGVVAILLVAGTVGGVLSVGLNSGRQEASPAQTMTTAPSPSVSASRPGTHVTLQPVPGLDKRLVIGTSEWLDEQGIDVGSTQGYESTHAIEPWTANLKDGSGRCILIRRDPGGTGGWSEIVCDADGVPAAVEREVDGVVLRFTIAGDVIDVRVTQP